VVPAARRLTAHAVRLRPLRQLHAPTMTRGRDSPCRTGHNHPFRQAVRDPSLAGQRRARSRFGRRSAGLSKSATRAIVAKP
jgi:hypothetical protein